MELKENILSSFIAFEQNVDVNKPLHHKRAEALKMFDQQGFPTKKMEAWKYTSLESLKKTNYNLLPKASEVLDYKNVKKYFLHEMDTYKLVFVNGEYSSFLSETTHDGVDICLMSSAITKEKYKSVIDNYFDKIADTKDALSRLNTAFIKEGAYIYIPKSKAPIKPVEIVYLTTSQDNASMIQPRNLIVAEENAEVQIIERHQNLTNNEVFTNVVTEIFAHKSARVDMYKLQMDTKTSSLIDNTFIEQHEKSVVRVHTFSFGGKLVRNNLNFYQKGSYIDSVLKGTTIIEDTQHVDHYTLVHHAEPNCESHQDYKGIFSGRSTGVFNGKIIVDKIAQKTNAFQQNNNLIVDDKATVNTKPQLEIFADDVKCSHGCTIGQLDRSALFYLQSRGIPKKEAEALLMYAFANDVLESVKIEAVQKRVKEQIADKLGVRLGFEF
ncbi:MAG: Fe-S cluster assembly protein SufD [Flavobacteriaceae bacterium]